MNNIITAENITKCYNDAGNKITAVDKVSLNIKSGEYLAIVGPSGAGKSTLIHMLGGLEPLTRGEVFYKGTALTSFSKKEQLVFRNQKVGFVFQFYYLIEELTVLENITLPAKIANKKNLLKDIETKAKDSCGILGLNERIDFYPSQLSGGEQQRVALARALINKPKILFCDEPTGNLDRKSSENICNLLNKINKDYNTTVVLVTHNLDLAKNAQRVLNIEKGKLVGKDKGSRLK